ncbi:MAG: hypothetical protein LH469_12555 [Frankiaceae bacterium]|nr:hypothetical protein [Frankiaceae bacterium]
MGRHRMQEEKRELGERAREMRAAGRSRREIQAELGIGDDLVGAFLAGTELPDALRRPRAKDDVREVARQLRVAGGTYDAIALELGVSKSTLSLWLRDLPHLPGSAAAVPLPATPGPQGDVDMRRQAARELREGGLLLKEIAERLGLSIKTVSLYVRGMPWVARSRHGGGSDHVRAMAEARWATHRRERDAAAQQRKLDAGREVGELDDRTLLLLGAVAYWCEGSKSKPWRPQGKWVFINSDPMLMRLMVRWLRLVDVPPERWVVRIQIHETGDLLAAEAYWRHVLGLPDLVFGKEAIKRHRPLTNRKNVGSDYHGCVSIYVRRGAELLQEVEGWMVGALMGAGGTLPDLPMPWSEECFTDAE